MDPKVSNRIYVVFILICFGIMISILIYQRIQLNRSESIVRDTIKNERAIYKAKEDSLNVAYNALETKYEKSDRERILSQQQYDSLKNQLKQKEIVYVTKNIPLLHAPIAILDSFWAAGHANN